MTEQELAKRVVEYLLADKWEVYQEVQIEMGGRIADIVAVRAGLVWVVECKRSFGFAVIDQAWHWSVFAHWVSIAVPRKGKAFGSRASFAALEALGIGVITVSEFDAYEFNSKTKRFNRQAYASILKEKLREEQKYWAAAGSASHDHFTPYKVEFPAVEFPSFEVKDDKRRYHNSFK